MQLLSSFMGWVSSPSPYLCHSNPEDRQILLRMMREEGFYPGNDTFMDLTLEERSFCSHAQAIYQNVILCGNRPHMQDPGVIDHMVRVLKAEGEAPAHYDWSRFRFFTYDQMKEVANVPHREVWFLALCRQAGEHLSSELVGMRRKEPTMKAGGYVFYTPGDNAHNALYLRLLLEHGNFETIVQEIEPPRIPEQKEPSFQEVKARYRAAEETWARKRGEKAMLNLTIEDFRRRCNEKTTAHGILRVEQLRQEARLQTTGARVISLEKKASEVSSQDKKVQEQISFVHNELEKLIQSCRASQQALERQHPHVQRQEPLQAITQAV